MSEGQEQNKTEEATPFKLRKAREKGQVARGMDLGFVGSLLAVTAVALIGGHAYFSQLAATLRQSFLGGVATAKGPAEAVNLAQSLFWLALQPLLALGVAILIILVTLDLIQLRGFFFTAQPLKPDFQRLNPAKGLKRLFSIRMLKETLKNILKMVVYSVAAWLVISAAVDKFGPTMSDAGRLAVAMESSVMRLLFVFIALAFFFMIIDQLLVRREYQKQMRMSRRELTRETKDREGEPRFKQKRRDIHAQMRAQTEGLGNVAGSDMLIVNPDHYAVALRYDPQTMSAPEVRAKGQGHFAQLMKRKARLLGIPIIPNVGLARQLYADCASGQPIQPHHFHSVAAIYRSFAQADIASPTTA